VKTEFEFIEKLRSAYGLGKVGDDCAVLPKDDQLDLVITSDLLVEEIDFRLDWTTPELLGHKALAVSLSDVAAMGAEPRSALLSLGIPEALWRSDLVARFYEGWHRLARAFLVELVGGDVSRSPKGLFIDSTVLGDVPKARAIQRNGASPGDGIFVAGTLGGAAGGLKLLESGSRMGGDTPSDKAVLLEKQLKPSPHLSIANCLQTQQLATAMIDISDGLSSDLGHICRESGVGAEIRAEKLPIEPALESFFNSAESLDMALNGGEDLALLFTGDREKILAAALPNVRHIGEVTANVGSIELITGDSRQPLLPKGYRHF